jgi:hypothetical protein
MTPFVWIAFAVMASGAILTSLAFRRLVDVEFKNFHDEWLRDGKPVGGPESRKAASFWRSGFSTQRASNTWLVYTPAWVRKSSEATAALRQFRIWTSVMAAGVLSAIAVALFAT